jgi:hypothetical protein
MKTKTLVVWQDGRPELERMARNLGERLEKMGSESVIKMASMVSIPEVLAASSYLFGADEAGNASYGEIARLLRGINLAGRPVAFFGANGAAIAWLREMTRDTELVATSIDLVGPKPEQSAIASVLRAFA